MTTTNTNEDSNQNLDLSGPQNLELNAVDNGFLGISTSSYSKLKEKSPALDILGPVVFTDILVQENAPGYYTHHMSANSGSMDIEQVARMLAHDGNWSTFGKAIADFNGIIKLIKKCFPMKKVQKDELSTYPRAIQDIIHKEQGNVNVAEPLLQVFCEVIKPLNLVLPDRGVVDITMRSNRFPTKEDIQREILVQQIIAVFQTVRLSIGRGQKNMTPAVLGREVAELLHDLSRKMIAIESVEVKFNATLLAVRKSFLHEYLSPDNRLPRESLLTHSNLRKLTTNATIVEMALSMDDSNIWAVPEDEISKHVDEIYLALVQSKRWKETSLVAATSHISHKRLVGDHNFTWGVCVSGHYQVESQPQVGIFIDKDSTAIPTYSFEQLEMYAKHVSDVTSPFLGTDIIGEARDTFMNAMDRFVDGESATDNYLVQFGASDEDIKHYALAKAGTVYLTRKSDNDNSFGIAYGVDTANERVKLDSTVLFNESFTTSPAIYLLCTPDHEATTPLKLTNEAVKKEHLLYDLVVGPNDKILTDVMTRTKDGNTPLKVDWVRKFARDINTRIKLGKEVVSSNTNTTNLLGLRSNETLYSVVQHTVTSLVSVFLKSNTMISKIMAEVNGKPTANEKTFIDDHLSIQVARLFERVMLTRPGNNMGRAYHNRLLAGMVGKDEKVEKALRRFSRDESYIAQVRFHATGIMLISAGIITFDDYKSTHDYLEKSGWFSRRIGDDRYKPTALLRGV